MACRAFHSAAWKLSKCAYAGNTMVKVVAGGATGYEASVSLRRGELGTNVLQASTAYFQRSAGGAVTFPTAQVTTYRNADGTGARTTKYAYTWYAGTTQAQSVEASYHAVSLTQNGPGTRSQETMVLDRQGRVVWTRDADGVLSHTAYDQGTGAVVKHIQDVDTTLTSTFADLPSGWATPTGGGLHLTTLAEVDGQGRTVKLTHPNGRVDYTTFDDANHEARHYNAWDSSTNTPTGPTLVVRDQRALGYVETLTMSATPNVSLGRPDGTEAIAYIQTLSRSYVNAAGQTTHTDAYFNLTGLTYTTGALGSVDVNYHRTSYRYDDRGRMNRVLGPTGTITRMVYDGLDRLVSTWVGTDDTPTTGFWSVTNPGPTPQTAPTLLPAA